MATPIAVQKEEKREMKPALAPRDIFEGAFFGNPFGLMRRFSREMDRLFEDFGVKPRLLEERMPAEALWAPEVELLERDGKLLVRADLPGLTKDDVKVTIVDEMLTLEGERKRETETKRDDYYRTERTYGSFYRAIPLPEGVKADQVEANFKNGVLEVVLPLTVVEKKTKKVEIKAA